MTTLSIVTIYVIWLGIFPASALAYLYLVTNSPRIWGKRLVKNRVKVSQKSEERLKPAPLAVMYIQGNDLKITQDPLTFDRIVTLGEPQSTVKLLYRNLPNWKVVDHTGKLTIVNHLERELVVHNQGGHLIINNDPTVQVVLDQAELVNQADRYYDVNGQEIKIA
ncbi:hypothetical protein FOD75_11340 (plasmid) [Limosilactobacillus reuteri]|uniref:Uncharacterized protein n=1 Tax=Limosilactobacillus reuteri TaxID=1598 RepID=A0A517D8K8_LIMRT|nr:hypothetical protein [Limosilactobacillus reuteri]QDR73678.1 hypothetical protein FOD75_11340 [Limosilactobacillus reuteri]